MPLWLQGDVKLNGREKLVCHTLASVLGDALPHLLADSTRIACADRCLNLNLQVNSTAAALPIPFHIQQVSHPASRLQPLVSYTLQQLS